MNAELEQWILDQTEPLARIRAAQEAEDVEVALFADLFPRSTEAQLRGQFQARYQFLLDVYREGHFACSECGEELSKEENAKARKGEKVCDECREHEPDTRWLDDPRHGQADSINRRPG